ncbi:MAG: hypothetical protein Q8J78_17365 [Moraxellaceae bacterium]|nr:hypothetical protein [Moraxellaceae bacterium]
MMSAAPKETPGLPLPAAVAAVWGAFVYEGLLAHIPDQKRTQAILDTWGQGCVELVIAATLHLPVLWLQISQKWETSDTSFPGVFEYEVVSPLGCYLADYLLTHDGDLPPTDEVAAEITRLIDAFFGEAPLAATPLSKAS